MAGFVNYDEVAWFLDAKVYIFFSDKFIFTIDVTSIYTGEFFLFLFF